MNILQASEFKKTLLSSTISVNGGSIQTADIILISRVKALKEKDEDGQYDYVFADEAKETVKGTMEAKYVKIYLRHGEAFVCVEINVSDLKSIVAKVMELSSVEIEDTIHNFEA
jgi:hypothetical protein